MAATPMAPAPMNRTCVLQMCAVLEASVMPAGMAPCMAVRIGTAMPHAMMRPANIAMPTDSPTRCPAPTSASDHAMSYPLAAETPTGKYPVNSPAAICVAVRIASPAEVAPPRITARSPSRASPVSSVVSPRVPDPTRSTSAAATPSGYGRSDVVTSARRNGIVNSTPRTPPLAHTRNDSQKGNPCHQPTITRPGSTKMIADSVPAADATVCTMLFSRIDESFTTLSTAIEITAAGMDEANVSPTLRPR